MRNLDEIINELLDIDRRINRLGFIYFGKGGFNPNQPRVPAGNPHGGQWTGGGGVSFNISNDSLGSTNNSRVRNSGDSGMSGSAGIPDTWGGNPENFQDHFDRHKRDFGAKTPKEYAKMANDFYKRFKVEKLPAIKYSSGVLGVYDPKSNIFALYNKNGKSITFYKPTSKTYFLRQAAKAISKGGKIINLMPNTISNAPVQPPQTTASGRTGRTGVGGARGGGGGGPITVDPKIPGNRSRIVF